MSDKQKRKNSDIALTRYDKGRLYVLYRLLHLSRTQQIEISASPEICMMHSKRFKAYLRDIEVVALEGGTEYEFQARIVKLGRGSDRISINGLIVENGDGQSLVTLRTYSHSGFIGIGCVIAFVVCGVTNQRTLENMGILESIVLFMIVFGFSLYLYLIGLHQRIEAVDILSNYLAKSGMTLKKSRSLKNIQRKS